MSTQPILRVLTVRNPSAWAIIHAGKDVENRVQDITGTRSPHRGLLAIHAATAYAPTHHEQPAITAAIEDHDDPTTEPWRNHPGHIIGVATLADVHHAVDCWTAFAPRDGGDTVESWCSEWALEDHWHLQLTDPRALPTPIPHRGGLGLRHLPEHVQAQIAAQLP